MSGVCILQHFLRQASSSDFFDVNPKISPSRLSTKFPQNSSSLWLFYVLPIFFFLACSFVRLPRCRGLVVALTKVVGEWESPDFFFQATMSGFDHNTVFYGFTPVPRDPDILFADHPTASGDHPKQDHYSVTDFPFPDSALVRDVKAFVKVRLSRLCLCGTLCLTAIYF